MQHATTHKTAQTMQNTSHHKQNTKHNTTQHNTKEEENKTQHTVTHSAKQNATQTLNTVQHSTAEHAGITAVGSFHAIKTGAQHQKVDAPFKINTKIFCRDNIGRGLRTEVGWRQGAIERNVCSLIHRAALLCWCLICSLIIINIKPILILATAGYAGCGYQVLLLLVLATFNRTICKIAPFC